jgi:hypothetical protein
MLGDRIATWLKISRDPLWDRLIPTLWPPFVAVREGLLDITKAPKELREIYWTFDEILRQGALLFLSEGKLPISIEIPQTNNPHY